MTLGVGFVGSGFVARFHIQSWQGVRNADVRGVYSPNAEHAASAAALAGTLGVGEAKPYASVSELCAAPDIDAVWICTPNYTRLDVMREIVAAVEGGARLVGVACEKPLARTLGEAREMLALAEQAGLLHGYLENQVFAPAVARGKALAWGRGAAVAGPPYLARCAEEHSGPHEAWFWRGESQGGGVLSDMMCHSLEAARFLLTPPGAPRDALTIESVNGQIASLKWTRPEYAAALRERTGVDYTQTPSEDFARATVSFRDADGNAAIAEATTSWSYVGPGLRLTFELLGPEYSLHASTLDAGIRLFLSREVGGSSGEDLVEKQNAEQGQMPIVEDEGLTYGYVAEDRHMVEAFAAKRQPDETFHDGVAVAEMLMAAYKSAEDGRTLDWPVEGLDDFTPAVAQGTWDPVARWPSGRKK